MALEQPPKKQIPTSKRIKRIAIALAVLAMYIWTFVSIDIDFARVIRTCLCKLQSCPPSTLQSKLGYGW